MLKQTPLSATHRAAGARMVDFGGWDMPVNYGSQIEEHHAVRSDAGMFDVSHMRVADLEGEGARAFLRYALANNVDKLRDSGKALYSCMLRPEGGVIDDLIVYFVREDFFRLVVNAGTADKDIAWLNELIAAQAPPGNAGPPQVSAPSGGGRRNAAASGGPLLKLAPRTDLAMIAVQGPNARARVWAVLKGSEAASAALKPFNGVAWQDLFIARTGYTGEDGFEVIVPASRAVALWCGLAAEGVRPCGLGARDTLRLEAGMNLYGQDMDETIDPLQSGLAWTVDLASPRDFVGKAALAALVATGRVEQQLIGLQLLDKGGVLRAHQRVRTALGEGEITSGTFSPTLGASIALARLPVRVSAGDTVQVMVRDKALNARVVKPPFARNGKALV